MNFRAKNQRMQTNVTLRVLSFEWLCQNSHAVSSQDTLNFHGKTALIFDSWYRMGDIRKKKKKLRRLSILSSNFDDHYTLSGHQLASGAFSRVEECFKTKHGPDNLIYAVKIIEKVQGFYSRPKILREIDTYHLCQGHPNIIQLLEYFEVKGWKIEYSLGM